jgi:hypothetical protein
MDGDGCRGTENVPLGTFHHFIDRGRRRVGDASRIRPDIVPSAPHGFKLARSIRGIPSPSVAQTINDLGPHMGISSPTMGAVVHSTPVARRRPSSEASNIDCSRLRRSLWIAGRWPSLFRTHSGVHPCTGIRSLRGMCPATGSLLLRRTCSSRAPARSGTDFALGNSVGAIGWRRGDVRIEISFGPTGDVGCFVTPSSYTTHTLASSIGGFGSPLGGRPDRRGRVDAR